MNQYETQGWIDVATTDSRERERAFLRSVFAWMAVGLALTAVAAFWVAGSPAMRALVLNGPALIVLVLLELGAVMFLSFRINRMSPGVAAGVFLAYSVLNGLTLSSIFLVYAAATITQAFVVAAGMFGAMAVFGVVTKKDLTSWGSFFFMGLIGVLLLSLVNMFVASSALSMTIGLVGVFVFVGLTAYDANRLKKLAGAGAQGNYAIIGALSLYLDFINLFLMLLRLFGGDRRR